MDHTEAVRLQAAEKYLLGELANAQREEFEEHYFDCGACADDLKATVAFMESSRQVFREGAPQTADAKGNAPGTGGWFAWLRPAFAIPALAALLLLIAYQNSVTIPSLKQGSSQGVTAEAVRYFSLLSVGARGEAASSLTVKVRPHEDFDLDVDMPGNSSSGYTCQIQDESGGLRHSVLVSSEEAKSTVRVRIPGGSLQPGKYNFLILTGRSLGGQTANAVVKLPFSVEFLR